MTPGSNAFLMIAEPTYYKFCIHFIGVGYPNGRDELLRIAADLQLGHHERGMLEAPPDLALQAG